MRRLTLSVLSLAILAACQPAATELTEEQKAEIAAEVGRVNAGFWDALRAADFDQAMSYFYNSSDIAFAVQGAVDYGYAEIDAKYRPGMARWESQDITITSSETMVLASDVVCTTDAGTWASTDTTAVAGPELDFARTSIWVRRGGEWKIHIGHESYRAPESESM